MATLLQKISNVFPTCNTEAKAENKLWELYQEHKLGVNEIGRLFCVDKATVSRRLQVIRARKGIE